jgi:hypothetical protein
MDQADPLGNRNAAEMAAELNKQFLEYASKNFGKRGSIKLIFDAIGYMRGGMNSWGGIFWCDIRDLRQPYQSGIKNVVSQICGHSSYAQREEGYPQFADNLWCIDTRGSVSALVTEDDGKSFEWIMSDIGGI